MRRRDDHEHPEVPGRLHPEQPEDREQLRRHPWMVGGYLAPTLVVLFTILWVLAAYWLIGWRTRDWSFGTAPYIPAQSVYTTRPFPHGPAPKQVQLPSRPKGGKRAER